MDTDTSQVVKDELQVTVVPPKEVLLDEPADEYYVHPDANVDRGMGLPLQEGHLRPLPEARPHRRSGFGAPAIAVMFGLLIAAFVLFNLWSVGQLDERIGGVLLLWGAGFSGVVYLLIRTP